MSEATVSLGYAKALVTLAISKGALPQRFAEIAGCDLLQAENPDLRVPFAIFQALMREAKQACGDPAFGLHFGAESQFVDMSIVGLITHAAETMGQAFEQMNRFARLAIEVDGHDSGDRFAITRRDGEVWIEDRRLDPNDFPELTEATFARFISNTARFMGDVPFAKHIVVTHTEPVHWPAYAEILKVPVTFASDRNAIAIHESWLSLPLPYSNQYVFGVFSDKAQALLEELLLAKTVKGQVESALIRTLHTGEFGMDQIARKLGQSRTSLYRKLKAEGVTFDGLVDTLRHRMAIGYLAGRKVSVSEAAYLLGFADPSAFSRAFKRWTGKSPREHLK